ncbi:hypothetical protein ASE01_03550 [Nocardioides sp. Root190]|uniref:hypothetical protein n=1 Tax=Nocardioides sp. Root190 TaxID=1736488 RepID=UPI0007001D83|nr:hypothetical protein [Nocardioides sp. Root190]KRB78361.1 hypothetical protein ASE01_03550 [Nocardioides sp. Root190]
MKNTTRTALRLIIATPLAASAIALGGFTDLAHAETPGFEPDTGGTIAVPGDDEDPRPEGPGDIGIPEDDEDPQPDGPGDIGIPEDDEDPQPDGPDDLAIPEPGDGPEDVPGDDVPADKGGDKGDKGDKSDKGGKNGGNAGDVNGILDVQVPNRIDAGVGPVASADEQELTLTWVLAGGGLVVAAGSLLARQRVASRTR